MAVLPPRPYALATSFVASYIFGTIFWTLGTALGIALAAKQVIGANELFVERDIWQRGVPAQDVKVTIDQFPSRAHSGYRLLVAYRDQRRGPHTGVLSFSDPLSSLRRDETLVVHYDQLEPNRFALNQAVEITGSRRPRWLAPSLLGASLLYSPLSRRVSRFGTSSTRGASHRNRPSSRCQSLTS
jgi:hypothetical protein